MIVFTTNNKRLIDVGSDRNWNVIRHTLEYRLHSIIPTIPNAYKFLKTGECKYSQAYNIAKEINMLRDAFSQLKPEQAVYIEKNKVYAAFLENDLSSVVTSCANVFLTSDGKDLLFEIVSILVYSGVVEVDVLSDGFGKE